LLKSITHDQFQEVKYLTTKIELMLNPEKDIELMKGLRSLTVFLYEACFSKKDYHEVAKQAEEVKLLTHKTLKTEWERVKKGE